MNSPHISRRFFLKLSAAAGALLPLHALPPLIPAAEPVLYHGDRQAPFVALTIDDCYSYSIMTGIEGVLAAFPCARATFFPVGVAIERLAAKDPEFWARLASRGHEYGYHSYTHATLSSMPTKEVIDDYDRWYEALGSALGSAPVVRFARPPFGDLSKSFLNMCAQRDLIPTMWSLDLENAAETRPADQTPVKAGELILFHASTISTERLRNLLSHLRHRALDALTMTDFYAVSLGTAPAEPINGCSRPSPENLPAFRMY